MGGLYTRPIYRLAGDRGLLVEYGDAIDPEVNRNVRAMSIALSSAPPPGLKEVIPTYCSLLIYYDPLLTDPTKLQQGLENLSEHLSNIILPLPDTIEIPVCYGGALGPDMDFVSEYSGLALKEIVRIHSEPSYQIHMIGFTPGFPFLGGLSKLLYVPRLRSPRMLVSAGSVGIANDQTGIYPIDSPGGWQLIGRTPFKLFDPSRPRPFLFKTGDLIKFKPITLEQYSSLLTSPMGDNE